MALDKNTLVTNLKSLFGREHTGDKAAELLADAIEAFVKTADVNVKASEIKVQGSATAQTNASPLKLTGGLS